MKNIWEFVRYALCGIATTVISIGTFVLFDTVLEIQVLLANALSWIFAVAFAYFSNRKWVFRSRATGKLLTKELLGFYGGRLITLGIEELLLLVLAVWLHFNSTVVKLLSLVIVLACNYLISKFVVFRNK